jgi:hypothetical protein
MVQMKRRNLRKQVRETSVPGLQNWREERMASETEGTLELLRAVTSILGGVRGLALAEAERLAPAAAMTLEESDEPEEGAALLGSQIRCIVRDQIEPAVQALRGLTGDLAPDC